MYNISLLTIGDEILIGQIINSNAAWIANECSKLGAGVVAHSSIGDNENELIDELERLKKKSDFIIISGGLGPTHDDVTKPTLTKYFNDKLELDKGTLNYLKEFFAKKNVELSERNRTQAYLPSKCKALPNKVGTAPGMLFDESGKTFVALPGVPTEMKYIMTNSVLPVLKNKIAESAEKVAMYKTLKTSGIVEAKLADLIGDPKGIAGDATIAFLPSYQGVRIRIGVVEKDFDKGAEKIKSIESKLKELVGDYIYGTENESLTSKIGETLKDRKETIALAESCTGGLLGADLTSISGSSTYFAGGAIVYSNEIKNKILGVKEQTLIDNGAVSEQTAKELATNVREKFGTDYGVGITGIAGPTGGTADKPVGTVWISLADAEKVAAKKFVFGEDRTMNRERSVGAALNMVLKRLKEKK